MEASIKVKVLEIVWDTECDDRMPPTSELPTEMEVLVAPADESEDALIDAISDAISDEVGFLVCDYSYEIV